MIRKIIFTVLWLLTGISLVTGQTDCPLLVERALQAVDDNCSEMGRNTACYAYNQVNATFMEDVTPEYFSEPSDRADLTYLESIQTAGLDESNDVWGIAMMSVQANVPGTLPGQAVVFMLMGDVQVENAVNPDEAFTPVDPIGVTTLVASSNIRQTPTDNGFVLGTAPLGTRFEADGLSENGQWVRIIFNEQPAWIFRNIVDSEGSLATLPVISDANRTPMQAFYFSTGTGASTCNEAPDSLMIQGPNSLEVQINANGVDINIGSTIVLESRAENEISITAINGYAQVENVRVPGGFTVDARTDENGTIQPETISGFRPMSDEQIERFKPLEKVENRSVVNYQVRVPTRSDIVETQVVLEQGQIRETIRTECQQAGLSIEECRNLVGSDTDRMTVYQRCLDAGYSADICRRASGAITSSGEGDGTTIGTGEIIDRCREAGYQTAEECREGFSGEEDGVVDICLALGYNNREECRTAFSDSNAERIRYCVSRGYRTKSECDATDAGQTATATPEADSGDDDGDRNSCQERGLTREQCRRLRIYRECRSQGRTDAECRRISGS